MKNVDYVVKDGILTIKVDLQKEFGLSATGKTTTVATSEGFVPVGESSQGIGFSLNVNKKLTK